MNDKDSFINALFLSLQTLGAGIQMFYLCMMLSLYAGSEIHGDHLESTEEFKMWMLVETFVAISTIISAVVYLFVRSLTRGALEFYIEK